jgi:hypothetical protein
MRFNAVEGILVHCCHSLYSGEDSCALLPNMQAISDAASASEQHDDNDSNKFKNYTLREY